MDPLRRYDLQEQLLFDTSNGNEIDKIAINNRRATRDYRYLSSTVHDVSSADNISINQQAIRMSLVIPLEWLFAKRFFKGMCRFGFGSSFI